MRISDWSSDVCSSDLMSLRAAHVDPDIDRPAPPDLYHVAEPVHRGWLADEDHVGLHPARDHMLHQRARAEDRGTFLVAGDDQAARPRVGGGRGGGGQIGRAACRERGGELGECTAAGGSLTLKERCSKRRHGLTNYKRTK